MRRTLTAVVAAAGCLAVSQAQAQEQSVNAVLTDPDGKQIGNVAISEVAQGVRHLPSMKFQARFNAPDGRSTAKPSSPLVRSRGRTFHE